MSDNVHRLANASISDEPVPNVVEMIEMLLDKAKRGELRAVAFAAVELGNGVATGHAYDAKLNHLLGGAVLMLHHRYGRFLIDFEERNHG